MRERKKREGKLIRVHISYVWNVYVQIKPYNLKYYSSISISKFEVKIWDLFFGNAFRQHSQSQH